MAIETVAYIEDGNPLHSLDLNCHAPNMPWVIFIHGGAWYRPSPRSSHMRRDPKQTSHDGDALLQYLQETKLPVSLASVNYRLSPAVRHPAHQEDVTAAIAFLKQKYGMKEFILVGHSAGACLCFQTSHVKDCKGVIGVEGIYDVEDLVKEYPEYEDFIVDAFGINEVERREASPINLRYDSPFLVVQLVQSTEDELLSGRQTELMQSRLKKTPVKLQEISWIKGSHNTSITTPEFFKVVHGFIAQIFFS